MNVSRLVPWLLLALLAIAAWLYVRSISPEEATPTRPPHIDFVVGGPDPFWELVVEGARHAADRYEVDLHVHQPDGSEGDQTRTLLELDTENSDGVAVSPLAPREQATHLSALAAKVRLVTYDNDAHGTTRLCYVGTNNWSAGEKCADLVKRALPDGGNLVIFVGDNERLNSQHRRDGFFGGLVDQRPMTDPSFDVLDRPVEIGKYTVLRTYLDRSDPQKAVENARQAIEEFDQIDLMVAMYGYNGPACLEALAESGKLGEIAVVAFDEHEPTLDGIAEGHVVGTIAQDPYRFGFEAVRILADLYRLPPTSSPFPGSGTMYLPTTTVTKANLTAFREQIEQRQGTTTGADSQEPQR